MEIYQVDAFCDGLFTGNPAAVCLMESWPEESLMQNIAAENNLAETAFCVNYFDCCQIRWFTPTVEVSLCGHATLAAAHVLFEHKQIPGDTIVFYSRSGELRVTKEDHLLTLDFPADMWCRVNVTKQMYDWFFLEPLEAYRGKTDYMLVFQSESDVDHIIPNLQQIQKHKEVRGVIVTAKGDSVDFVSRFFAPQSGIPEDPVTGSAHTTLTGYWSEKLGKKELDAIQLSSRKGFLRCRDEKERVKISGKARTFMVGSLMFDV